MGSAATPPGIRLGWLRSRPNAAAMVWRSGTMETLFAIGMLVGLMKPHAEPPKIAPAPVEQQQVQQRMADSDKARPHNKKSEWLLSY